MGMENERVVYNPLAIGSGAGGMGFGNGGLLEGLLFASLLGRNGRGGLFGGNDGGNGDLDADAIAAKVVELQETGDIKELVGELKGKLNDEFRSIEQLLSESDKDAIKASYEAKIASLQSTNEINNKIDANTIDVKNQLFAFQTKVDSQFCHVDSKIEKGNAALALQAERDTARLSLEIERKFAHQREEELESEIDELRSKKRELEQNAVLVSLANQIQHLSNSVVQIGAANVAAQTPTTTNVRS